MGLAELVLVAVGLSMDAFAVAVCKGLAMKRLDMRQAFVIAAFFGGFQAAMPVLGWALGSQFASVVEPVDHWVAFALLAFVGAKMLMEGVRMPAADGDVPPAAAPPAPAAPRGQATPVALSAAAPGPPPAPGPQAAPAACSSQAAPDQAAPAAPAAPCAPAPASPELDLKELAMLAVATSIDALAVGVSFAFLRVNIATSSLLIGCVTFALSFAGVAAGHQFGRRWERPSTIAGGVVLVLMGAKILAEHLGLFG